MLDVISLCSDINGTKYGNESNINVTVVTVNWNRFSETCDCIDSFLVQESVNVSFIIVDNGSTDGSQELLREKYPDACVISLPKNLGFAGGFNIGICRAIEENADFVLIVNNDTVADKKLLKELLSGIQEREVGVVAPVIYYSDPKDKTWSAGGNIATCLLQPINSHHIRNKLPVLPVYRTFLSGCCLLIKKEVIKTFGLFDERFFLYYEDLDYCLRIRNVGWKMKLIPNAKLWHKGSLSSNGKMSANERYFMARSSGIYFRKHMNFFNSFIIIPFRVSSALLWSLRLIMTQNKNSLRAYWRGLRDGWTDKS